jgi:transcriptional regulator with XRE-family HTH domain
LGLIATGRESLARFNHLERVHSHLNKEKAVTEDMLNEPTPTVSQWITIEQSKRGLTDADIAIAAGLNERTLLLLREGKLKLPIKAAKGVARALGADPRELLDVMLNDYMPELRDLINDLRTPLELTDNERELLKRYRLISKGRDAAPVIVSGITLVFPKSM